MVVRVFRIGMQQAMKLGGSDQRESPQPEQQHQDNGEKADATLTL
jgi:hypothetical protein